MLPSTQEDIRLTGAVQLSSIALHSFRGLVDAHRGIGLTTVAPTTVDRNRRFACRRPIDVVVADVSRTTAAGPLCIRER